MNTPETPPENASELRTVKREERASLSREKVRESVGERK